MREVIQRTGRIPEEAAGKRFDQALAELFPDFSRSRLTGWIREGQATLDGRAVKPRQTVRGGEAVAIAAELAEDSRVAAQPIELDVVHRDEDILVINKPPGLVVHPAAGNPDGTLQNALLHLDPSLAALPRAGIVHRLDKDTSGLMVVARTLEAHTALVRQLQERRMGREYDTVVKGLVIAGGSVDAPVGRHPTRRTRMAVTGDGKPALSEYRVREKFRAHTRLRVKLASGRTHQIRVHMAHIHHPVVGDPAYGGRPVFPPGAGEDLRRVLEGFRRQALHAERLTLEHPASGETRHFQVPCPEDMTALIEALRRDAREHG